MKYVKVTEIARGCVCADEILQAGDLPSVLLWDLVPEEAEQNMGRFKITIEFESSREEP